MAKKPQKMSCRNREESNRVSSNDESSGGVSVSSSTAPETEEEINSHAKRWDQMFSRLLAFKKKYGHVNVPNRHKEDPSLGSWVSAQRRQYKIVTSGQSGSTAMTLDRAKKLADIGFEWSTINPNHVTWETRFEELKEFVSKYGHAQVPMRWKENETLSNWVSKQRQDYKLLQNGQSSRLSPERLKLLNEVGFIWEVDRATSRQLKGAVLKAQDRSALTLTNPSRQSQSLLIFESKPPTESHSPPGSFSRLSAAYGKSPVISSSETSGKDSIISSDKDHVISKSSQNVRGKSNSTATGSKKVQQLVLGSQTGVVQGPRELKASPSTYTEEPPGDSVAADKPSQFRKKRSKPCNAPGRVVASPTSADESETDTDSAGKRYKSSKEEEAEDQVERLFV